MSEMRTYCIRSRYFEDGWQIVDAHVRGSLYDAGKKASEVAHELDDNFGSDHFWTVDIYHLNDDLKEDGLGSYYQLFHGRLR